MTRIEIYQPLSIGYKVRVETYLWVCEDCKRPTNYWVNLCERCDAMLDHREDEF